MIKKYVTRFLRQYITNISKEYQIDSLTKSRFQKYICEHYSHEDLLNSCNDIKLCFKDHFREYGDITFKFHPDQGLEFKLIPYDINPKDSNEFKNLVTLLKDNEDLVEYPFNNSNDLIGITGKLRSDFYTILSQNRERVNKKELIKVVLQTALQLSERDVIMIQKTQFIIKIFDTNKHLNKTLNKDEKVQKPKPINHSEKRFNGFNPDELEKHFKLLFSNTSIDDFYEGLLITLFSQNLNFKKISHNFYEKNALTLIKSSIFDELSRTLSNNSEYIDGLAGYIFREHFEIVHNKMALHLLKELSKSECEKVELFLKHYNGQSRTIHDRRYKFPILVNKKGTLWNITSIKSLASLWLKPHYKHEKVKIKILNTEEENKNSLLLLKRMKKDLEPLVIKYEEVLPRFAEAQAQVKKVDTLIQRCRDKHELANVKQEHHRYYVKCTSFIEQNETQLNELKNNIRKSKVEIANLATYIKKLIQIVNQLQVTQIKIEKNLLIHEPLFKEVLHDIQLVLMQRKKPVS